MARTRKSAASFNRQPKKIDSQAPDVTIIVGSGDNAKETKFYGVILASASPYLDAMLSNGMMESKNRIIRFPEKNPLEWDVVLRCIDPSNALLFTPEPRVDDVLSSYQDAPSVLAPWFNELQMQPYLKRCDEILCTQINITDEKIQAGRVTRAEIAKLVEDLTFAINYNLTKTRDKIESKIMDIMEQFLWGLGDEDHFDIATVRSLLQCMAPIQRFIVCRKIRFANVEPQCKESIQRFILRGEKNTTNDEPAAKKQRSIPTKGISCKGSNCEGIWNQICSCLEMPLLYSDMMNDINGFSQFVYHSLQSAHTHMKQHLKDITHALVGKNEIFNVIVTAPAYRTTRIKCEKDGEGICEGDLDKAIMKILGRRGNFKRSYSFSYDEKVIRVFAYKQNDGKMNIGTRALTRGDLPAVEPGQQTIRFCDTDFTVKVGNGAAAKEFQCHKTILAFASKKLDELVTEASNDLLLLPDINPDVWELFYESINPRQIQSVGNNEKYTHYQKAKLLAPLYHMFDMVIHLNCCCDIFNEFLECLDDDDINEVVALLQLALACGLTGTKINAEKFIETLFRADHDTFYIVEDISVDTLVDIVSLCLPIERPTAEDAFQSARCPTLFQGLTSLIGHHLKSLKTNKVEENEFILFAHLVHAYIQSDRSPEYHFLY